MKESVSLTIRASFTVSAKLGTTDQGNDVSLESCCYAFYEAVVFKWAIGNGEWRGISLHLGIKNRMNPHSQGP